MSESQAATLKLLTQLGIGVIALGLLAGVLYYQRIDRQMELDRVESLREAEMLRYEQHSELLQTMIQEALSRQDGRAHVFMSQQEALVDQGERVTVAVEEQVGILKGVKAVSQRNMDDLSAAIEEANRELIEVLSKPVRER